MISLLNLPKLPYIIFELIRYEVYKNPYKEGRILGPGISVDMVMMDVLPSRIQYKFASKKTYMIGLGDDNTLVSKGGLAPTKISFSGTFGQRWISRGIRVQDGFGRLKEFKKLYETSQSVHPKKKDKYVYGMNYYDLTLHYWSAVDLDNFEIDEDAQRNTKLPFYNLQFTSVGKLVNAKSKDPILRNIKYFILAQNKLDEWNSEIDNFLTTNEYAAGINEILVDIASYEIALGVAHSMVNNYVSAVRGSFLGDVYDVATQMYKMSVINTETGMEQAKGFGELLSLIH